MPAIEVTGTLPAVVDDPAKATSPSFMPRWVMDDGVTACEADEFLARPLADDLFRN